MKLPFEPGDWVRSELGGMTGLVQAVIVLPGGACRVRVTPNLERGARQTYEWDAASVQKIPRPEPKSKPWPDAAPKPTAPTARRELF